MQCLLLGDTPAVTLHYSELQMSFAQAIQREGRTSCLLPLTQGLTWASCLCPGKIPARLISLSWEPHTCQPDHLPHRPVLLPSASPGGPAPASHGRYTQVALPGLAFSPVLAAGCPARRVAAPPRGRLQVPRAVVASPPAWYGFWKRSDLATPPDNPPLSATLWPASCKRLGKPLLLGEFWSFSFLFSREA